MKKLLITLMAGMTLWAGSASAMGLQEKIDYVNSWVISNNLEFPAGGTNYNWIFWDATDGRTGTNVTKLRASLTERWMDFGFTKKTGLNYQYNGETGANYDNTPSDDYDVGTENGWYNTYKNSLSDPNSVVAKRHFQLSGGLRAVVEEIANEAYADGYEDGYNDGYADGYRDGFAAGASSNPK